VANILHEAGAGGVVIEDREVLDREWESPFGEVYQLSPDDYPKEGVIVKAYLPVNSFLAETVEEIKAELNNLLLHDIDPGAVDVTLTEVHEEEWATAWKKYYKPVKISERFTITPSWETYEAMPDELVIELDPGMAFGTGTHPTTVMCMRALERCVKVGDYWIDVGCGTGVLSIAAAKLGAIRVDAVDLDEVAVKSAELNVKLNGVADRIHIRQNNLLNNMRTPADGIVANILAEVIMCFVQDASELLKPGGWFIASGIIAAKAGEVKKHLQETGLQVVETLAQEDWVAFIAKKQ
jgi:ribosomal protein L11 methyltransferase